jgi:hypothetical protein
LPKFIFAKYEWEEKKKKKGRKGRKRSPSPSTEQLPFLHSLK